jgi:aldehyde:ferredoxin oxidoreductase
MALHSITVDLERGHARQQLPTAVERDFLGGRGAVGWLLWHHLPINTPPLAPENLLIFAAGPLAGTPAFASGGFVAGTRSPITGTIAYGWAQGHWGAALRRSGLDVMMIRGQAPDWCYLQIDHASVRLRPAQHLLGQDTLETAESLRQELGSDYRTICIGPAGEAGVAYAGIVAEGRYPVEPAGTGAVMASKRLKAIAIRDGAPIEPVDHQRFHAALEVIRRRVNSSPLATAIRRSGSAHMLANAIADGAVTGRNGLNPSSELTPQKLQFMLEPNADRIERGCHACPLPCYFDQRQTDGTVRPVPELELLTGFGAGCDLPDGAVLQQLADRCLRLGLDPVATAAALAYLMECREEGLSTAGPEWGDAAAVFAAIDRLGERQEKRDMLSLGVGEIHQIFWSGHAFAPQAKGMAMPTLDPRAMNELALALAAAPIGADHRYAMAYEELVDEPPAWLPAEQSGPRDTGGKASRLIWHERFAAILDAAGICRRLGLMAYQISPAELLVLINAATGTSLKSADIGRIGERIVTIERLFAGRYSDNAAPDGLPDRWSSTPLPDGPAAGHLPPIPELLTEYYRRHGWDSTGNPRPERLAELGIKIEP